MLGLIIEHSNFVQAKLGYQTKHVKFSHNLHNCYCIYEQHTHERPKDLKIEPLEGNPSVRTTTNLIMNRNLRSNKVKLTSLSEGKGNSSKIPMSSLQCHHTP